MTELYDEEMSPVPESPFERIKQVDDDENEFWSARDLMPILEYSGWQRFRNVLLKAQIACENSGYDPADHFLRAFKMIAIGSDTRQYAVQRTQPKRCLLLCNRLTKRQRLLASGSVICWNASL